MEEAGQAGERCGLEGEGGGEEEQWAGRKGAPWVKFKVVIKKN